MCIRVNVAKDYNILYYETDGVYTSAILGNSLWNMGEYMLLQSEKTFW